MKLAGFIFLCGLLACGCSSGNDDDEDFTCDVVADRDGTYWAEYEMLSGSCGDQEPGLIRLDGTAETPAGCVELSPAETSDAGCTLEVRRLCDASQLAPGVEIEVTGITTQQDEAGDVITGTMTMTIRDASGTVCSGSYRMTATRLYVSTTVATHVLDTLAARGFFAAVDGAYRYQPESADLAIAVDQLADAYRGHLVAITEMIHAKPSRHVRDFANAFRLRKPT
jgi:hypothetical protein